MRGLIRRLWDSLNLRLPRLKGVEWECCINSESKQIGVHRRRWLSMLGESPHSVMSLPVRCTGARIYHNGAL